MAKPEIQCTIFAIRQSVITQRDNVHTSKQPRLESARLSRVGRNAWRIQETEFQTTKYVRPKIGVTEDLGQFARREFANLLLAFGGDRRLATEADCGQFEHVLNRNEHQSQSKGW